MEYNTTENKMSPLIKLMQQEILTEVFINYREIK